MMRMGSGNRRGSRDIVVDSLPNMSYLFFYIFRYSKAILRATAYDNNTS